MRHGIKVHGADHEFAYGFGCLEVRYRAVKGKGGVGKGARQSDLGLVGRKVKVHEARSLRRKVLRKRLISCHRDAGGEVFKLCAACGEVGIHRGRRFVTRHFVAVGIARCQAHLGALQTVADQAEIHGAEIDVARRGFGFGKRHVDVGTRDVIGRHRQSVGGRDDGIVVTGFREIGGELQFLKGDRFVGCGERHCPRRTEGTCGPLGEKRQFLGEI